MFLVALPLLARVVIYAPDGIDAVGASHTLSPGNNGRWGPATSTVDWCEENYVTWHVAELFNVLSSLVIVAHGVYGVVMHPWQEARYYAAFAGLIVVGLGSAAFHGTLWRSMQLMDELPMVWVNSVFIYIAVCMRDPVGTARWGLAALLAAGTAVATLAVIFLDKDDQNVFLLSYGSGVLFLVYKTRQHDRALNSRVNKQTAAPGSSIAAPERQVLLMDTSVVLYLGGFVAWLTDRNFCAWVRPLHLHSVWHLGASSGTFCAVLTWLWLRQRSAGEQPVVKGVVPLQTIVVPLKRS